MLYTKLLENYSAQSHIVFLSCEKLCRIAGARKSLNKLLNISLDPRFIFKESQKEVKETYDTDLLNHCRQTYQELSEISV